MKKFIAGLLTILTAIVFVSCDRAPASVYTLVSDDCGVHWRLIQPGQTVPKRITACELKTTIPGAPMGGESNFKTTFANNVKANIDLDYTYEIVDPVLFIQEARYLAKTNADGDEVSGNISRFETAENQVIDKAFKDIARESLNGLDIVDFDQSEFEDLLDKKVNERLSKRGVRVSSISFVPTPSEQTAQAIDVAQAMKIYESKGMKAEGTAIVAAKSGATKITISAPTPQKSED